MKPEEAVHWFRDYFLEEGVSQGLAVFLNAAIVLLALSLVLYGVDYIIKNIIVKAFNIFTHKTKTQFDDYLAKSKFPAVVAHIVPVIIVKNVFQLLFDDLPGLLKFSIVAIDIYTVILIVNICRSILNAFREYLKSKPHYAQKPLKSYQQVIMTIIWIFAILYMIYYLSGKSVEAITSLGAASALLMLMFRDTILGFIASVQITVNDTVRIGDWVTFNSYGADGIVSEINLTSVLIKNWDNTYTSIPTYSLISSSFQNWRGMLQGEGRRMKRSIIIKQNTVKFLTPEDLERFKKIELIKPYIEHRAKDHQTLNEKNEVDTSMIINGRQQTNLGLFRKYANVYLNKSPAILKDVYVMVRHLQPTEKGIPLEIVCFCSDKNWVNFEHIQADIFDHLIAAVPYFDLEIYELPSGHDISHFEA